jgi:hypothetical protein
LVEKQKGSLDPERLGAAHTVGEVEWFDKLTTNGVKVVGHHERGKSR